jgi:hypothetical protein
MVGLVQGGASTALMLLPDRLAKLVQAVLYFLIAAKIGSGSRRGFAIANARAMPRASASIFCVLAPCCLTTLRRDGFSDVMALSYG